MKYHVPGMACGHCRASIERAVATADPDAQVTVDLQARTVEIGTARGDADMRAALAAAGYEAEPA